MPPTLYGIPNCDTVKKARQWLGEHGIASAFHDFKKDGVPADRLGRWMAVLGADKLLNRQGTTWRKLDVQAQLRCGNAQGARALMLAQPRVIRRPVVEWPDGAVTAGFDAATWEARKNA